MAVPTRALASRMGAASFAFAAGVAPLLLGAPQASEALVITNGGVNYDVEIYNGSYNSNPSYFNTPANGGRMPWWGDQTLAATLAEQLGAALSPSPLPNDGPLFAYGLQTGPIGPNTPSGGPTAVDASFLDLTSLGGTNTVNSNTYLVGTTQTYVVLVTPPPSSTAVPAPLPLFGAAAAFGASRRLRRRVHGAPRA